MDAYMSTVDWDGEVLVITPTNKMAAAGLLGPDASVGKVAIPRAAISKVEVSKANPMVNGRLTVHANGRPFVIHFRRKSNDEFLPLGEELQAVAAEWVEDAPGAGVFDEQFRELHEEREGRRLEAADAAAARSKKLEDSRADAALRATARQEAREAAAANGPTAGQMIRDAGAAFHAKAMERNERFEGIHLGPTAVRYKGKSVTLPCTARVESAGEIQKRVTVTRLALFGVFALAAPKATDKRELYLTVENEHEALVASIDPEKGLKARQFAAKINSARPE